MNPAAKLIAFALVLVVVFSGGVAVGAAVDPIDSNPPPAHTEHTP